MESETNDFMGIFTALVVEPEHKEPRLSIQPLVIFKGDLTNSLEDRLSRRRKRNKPRSSQC